MNQHIKRIFVFCAATLCCCSNLLAAEGGEEEGGIQALLGTPWAGITTLIAFGIVLALLGKFVWPPVLMGLKRREDFIRDSLTSAKKEREEASQLLTEYKAQLEKARQEATAIVDEGRRDAQVVHKQILEDAKSEAAAALGRAKREIKIARDTAVKDLYTLSGELATQLAGKIIEKEIDEKTHERLIQQSIEKIAELRQENN